MTHDENKVTKPRKAVGQCTISLKVAGLPRLKSGWAIVKKKAVGYSSKTVLLVATLCCAYNEDNNLY
jgi:hypothetical protein